MLSTIKNTKMVILIINIVSVLAVITYGVFLYLDRLGDSFGNSTPISNAPEILFQVSILVVIVLIIFSNINHSKYAILLAIVPIVFLIVGIFTVNIYDSYMFNKNNSSKVKETEKKLTMISKDYICKGYPVGEIKESFITKDSEDNSLIHIKVLNKYDGSYLEAYPVGKIKDKNLEVFQKEILDGKTKTENDILKKIEFVDEIKNENKDEFLTRINEETEDNIKINEFIDTEEDGDYGYCFDVNNKTIYDNYNLVFNDKQYDSDYNLKKYEKYNY